MALRAGWTLLRSHLLRQRLQSLLLVLGMALGVAVIIAVDLANTSAQKGFALSTQALTGKATHRISGSPTQGVPQSVYVRLRREWGQLASAPVLTGYVRAPQLQGRTLRVLGVDPFAEAPFRPYLNPTASPEQMGRLTPFLTRNDGVLLAPALAAELPSNRRLLLEYGTRRTQVEALGTLTPPDALSAASLGQVLLADIGTAQAILGRSGQLSHIDLLLPEGETAAWEARLQPLLVDGLRLEPARAEADALQQMTRAFSLNLTALSLLALLVGMFLIYNIVGFSVVRRRAQLGILRALGVSKAEIFALILSETTLLALLGLSLGVGLGVLMGQGALRLVVQTINDLYFSLEVTRLSVEPASVAKGLLGGALAALAAALLPAWEATTTPPAGVLRRSGLEARLERLSLPAWGGGLALMLLTSLLVQWPSDSLVFSFGCFFGFVLGATLTVPQFSRWGMALLARVGPVLWRQVPRNLARSLSRSAVAIAALMVSVAVVLSVSLMIGSFRQTVLTWLDSTLAADVFITLPASPGDPNLGAPAALLTDVRAVPGVARAESARHLQINSPTYGRVNLLALSRDIAKERRYLWRDGAADSLPARLRAGGVLVSEPFANRHGLVRAPGLTLTLPTDQGPRRFRVWGIYRDYASEQGAVMLDDAVYRRHWQDTLISSVAVYLQPERTPEAVIAALHQRLDARYPLVIQSNRDLRQGAVEVFDRTFALTAALQLLAVVVAFMGVFSTLMALLLERRREFGTLRALGLTPRQTAALMLSESGLMGLSAGLMALPLGTVLSLFLIYVINLRSFGWTMDLQLHPLAYFQALGLALGAALLAGLWPAWQVIRTSPAQAMRAP
ncbi:MAG: FtsX-like permease family protein [Candidatus Sericytochromatia bacterium]